MYDNKKIVTYIMVHPYVEIPCNHLNYVFEEEYIILENAYNFKKKENTHCKQSMIILWEINHTYRKNTPKHGMDTNVFYFLLVTFLIILKGLQ